MGKQLNIRSDEAYALAHRLARTQRRSVTAVVEDALRQEAMNMDRRESSLIPKAQAEFQRIMELARQVRAMIPPDTSLDHSDMYDENGLPI
jgi:hypothetical protein